MKYTSLLLLLWIMVTNNLFGQDKIQEKADALAHKFIIVDGHVDFPYQLTVKNFRLQKELLDFSVQSKGNFDYVKAKKGGLDAPFMSIYIPSELQKTASASKEHADMLIDKVEEVVKGNPDKFMIATSPKDIEIAFKEGKIALPMGMENGSGIEDDLANLAHFYKRGIRYITLAHAKDNLICDAAYDTLNTWNGVSPFGEKVIQEMNNLGIMVDISHVTDSAFYDAIRLSKAPVIASHSSARFFTPEFIRNMSDDMIETLGQHDGIIMINFGSTFLAKELRENYKKAEKETEAYIKENSLEEHSEEAEKFFAERMEFHNGYARIGLVADHVDHIVKLAGIDHVGFGSDFDGLGDELPEDLKDVSMYPNLIAELLRRGYSEKDIEKICYKNIFRVWKEVEKVAKKS
ncbi:dipeptidase [Limibacter armeniacum]|uniref:dipeptidase n=1 Tax=Limibacter armeniacum TaxID=466084 RepID=UPI002FE50B9D